MNNYWKNKNVFVTGATGFLGSWLVGRLLERGAKVTALVRDHVPNSDFHRQNHAQKINIVHGALEDYILLERTLGEYEIDTIFHLGAQALVEVANRNPLSTFESNIRGTWNILEAARRTPTIKRVVVASSDKAYGIHKELPYDENKPLHGRHPYDVSKSAADMIAQTYYVTYKLPVVITRCGNLFGGGDLNFSRIIPGTIKSFLGNTTPIIRSDGKFIRDYFYVEDAADAYLTLAEKMEDPAIHGHAFNFGGENIHAVLEVVDRLKKIMGSSLEPRVMNIAKSEIPEQYLSLEKSKKILGWAPKHDFDSALVKTIGWYKNYFKA
ncbi:MAG: GDP-mannose 4,6-dehydratase [Candidatus Giovannonibacteria bacterium]|nr:GDP-mannose 4,6-dehydratase [Candidatus Giovannonibacteria bacterium]